MLVGLKKATGSSTIVVHDQNHVKEIFIFGNVKQDCKITFSHNNGCVDLQFPITAQEISDKCAQSLQNTIY